MREGKADKSGSADSALRPLLDLIGDLHRQDAEYDWAGAEALTPDERHQKRHLPLVDNRHRSDLSQERMAPGEFWPPVRSVAADPGSAAALADLRRRFGGQHRPLLAGFLQLTDGVTGHACEQLREIVADYQRRFVIPITVPSVAVIDTMDDLLLRSRVLEHMDGRGQAVAEANATPSGALPDG